MGKLRADTPISVLFYIAECHGIEVDRQNFSHAYVINVMRKINDLPISSFPESEINNNLSLISQFVSPYDVKWRRKELIEAFQWLLKFSVSAKINYDELPSKYGPLAPDATNNLDVCILYNLCQRSGIDVPPGASIGDIYELYLISRYSNRYLLANVKQINLDKLKKSQLINILVAAGRSLADLVRPPPVTRAEIDREIEAWPVKQWLPEAVNSNVRAIIVAAHRFNIDLTKIDNPLLAFEACSKDRCNVRGARWLKSHYNPLLPDRLYGAGILDSLLYEEGFTTGTIFGDKRSLLDCAYASDSFIPGIAPAEKRFNNETLVTYEDISELEDQHCVSYGSRASDIYYVTTYEELFQCFKQYQFFYNPTQRDFSVFEPRVMRRLILLANRNGRQDLAKLITELFQIEPLKNDKRIFQFRSGPVKAKVQQLLKLLCEAAMYMRGWKVLSDTYPLHSLQTYNVDADTKKSNEITANSNVALLALINYIEQNPDVKFVLDFPLIKIKSGQIILADKAQGYTIGGRIEIVRKGDQNDINACIRVSSNWFLHTYCILCNELQIKTDFSPGSIAEIS